VRPSRRPHLLRCAEPLASTYSRFGTPITHITSPNSLATAVWKPAQHDLPVLLGHEQPGLSDAATLTIRDELEGNDARTTDNLSSEPERDSCATTNALAIGYFGAIPHQPA
jgi:hypothetical protein